MLPEIETQFTITLLPSNKYLTIFPNIFIYLVLLTKLNHSIYKMYHSFVTKMLPAAVFILSSNTDATFS